MACETTQTWLLRADTLHPECWPTDLAEHVQACPDCAKLAGDLRQLEDDWKHLPMPAEAEQAKAAFVQQIPALRRSIAPPRKRVKRTVRWAVAASFVTGVGALVWMIMSPGMIVASPLVDDLIAWNLALSDAEPGERKRLYEQREAGFRTELQKAKLSDEERDLAERLLAAGRWIAANDDPLAEAGKLSDIAEKLVRRIDVSSQRGDVAETQRWVQGYSKMEQGVNNSMQRAGDNKGWEPEKKKAFEDMREQHEKWQHEQFQKMTEHAIPQIRKMFESMNKGRPGFPGRGSREHERR